LNKTNNTCQSSNRKAGIFMLKKIKLFVPILLVLLILNSIFIPTIKKSENISENVFRLHILANSDSNEDQSLKLKVRDEILKISSDIFVNCDTKEQAINQAIINIDKFKETATKVIKSEGYDYQVNISISNEYFNTRKYDNFTLPSGFYDSLKIEIGQAKGHNWWCVMFPSVCISGCTDDFDKSLTKDEIEMIESDKYVVRFKAVEIYEKIKKSIKE
jgi:stage II sporulation protein R